MTENLTALVQKLNPVCKKKLEEAAAMCVSASQYNIEVEHWLVKLLEDSQSDMSCILKHYQINIGALIQDLTKTITRFKSGNAQAPVLSPRLVGWIREAFMLADLEYNSGQIRSGILLHALLRLEEGNPFQQGFYRYLDKIKPNLLPQELTQFAGHSQEASNHSTAQSGNFSALNQFTVNMTQLASQGKIDPVIGREEEIRQLIDILTRRRQNNPVLTGEPGVGKTAVVEGLALRIAKNEISKSLQKVALHTLDLGLLQAGAGIKGEFENRLKSVINEVQSSPHPIILFIDEAHTLIGAGGTAGQGDAANLLKPVLARGELRVIAATTWSEYKKYFEQDAALARRFQVVKVDEPDEVVAAQMLRGLVSALEKHHQVRILDEAVIAAVNLSNRYLTQRQLPDKAISVLDTACARLSIRDFTYPVLIQDYQSRLANMQSEIDLLNREQALGIDHSKRLTQLTKTQKSDQDQLNKWMSRLQKERDLIQKIRRSRFELENMVADDKKMNLLKKDLQAYQDQLKKLQGEEPLLQDCIDAQCIAEVVSAWTGIPLGRMVSKEVANLLNLEKNLQTRVVGQDHALSVISQNIRIARAQLTDPGKPIGTFLFAGPSGVGKTETAYALAELMYGSERSMTVINLSEFKEEHKVSLLVGSPPGYVGYGEGGILTEAVRRQPYSLILLDELEKAHPGVQDVFYQVFDKGSLRDGQGRDINFKNTIIILTSNVAGDLIAKLCSDPATMPDTEALSNAIRPELLKVFKPAFLGRVTVVPYLPLSDALLRKIAELQLQRIQYRVFQNYQVNLTYNPDVIETIIKRCQEIESGARAIDHLLTRHLLPELATQFLTQTDSAKAIKKAHITITSQNQFLISKC